MNDSGYVVAFNILESGYQQLWLAVIGLLFIPIGIVALCLADGRSRIETGRPSKRDFVKRLRAITIALVGLSLVCTLVLFLGTFEDYWPRAHALASGKASFVEGTVDNFVPMPYQGHANETFTVKGVPFSYSDFEIQAGFNNSSSHGGPIRQGLPVRVWYVGNEIVKLEIKR